MNIACYIRVSTADQAVENQLPGILGYCRSHQWPEPEIYAEQESAWRQGHQRELARLLAELRTGRRKYDYLVIFALDRLTRGKVGEVVNLINAFEQTGCRIISLKESWLAEAGPMRDLFTLMIAWAANYESERKIQNTRAGLQRARANGKVLGRPVGKKDSKKRIKKRPIVYRYTAPSITAEVQ
ncbi:recombinase family protein [Chloroflexota bacterium]